MDKYPCTDCRRSFTRWSELVDHTRQEHEPNIDEILANRPDPDISYREVANDVRRLCNEIVKDYDYQAQAAAMSIGGGYACPSCRQEVDPFDWDDHVGKHAEDVFTGRVLLCPECYLALDLTGDEYKNHMRIHELGAPKDAGEAFTSYIELLDKHLTAQYSGFKETCKKNLAEQVATESAARRAEEKARKAEEEARNKAEAEKASLKKMAEARARRDKKEKNEIIQPETDDNTKDLNLILQEFEIMDLKKVKSGKGAKKGGGKGGRKGGRKVVSKEQEAAEAAEKETDDVSDAEAAEKVADEEGKKSSKMKKRLDLGHNRKQAKGSSDSDEERRALRGEPEKALKETGMKESSVSEKKGKRKGKGSSDSDEERRASRGEPENLAQSTSGSVSQTGRSTHKPHLIGREGEKVAFEYFSTNSEKNVSVTWVNQYRESGLPYDLILEASDCTREYIEVKATIQADKEWFNLSINEIQFAMEKGEAYSVAHVSLSDDPPKVTMYRNVKMLMHTKKLKMIGVPTK